MQKHFIFLDIDGTLMTHELLIPESAKKAVAVARANGHKVFLCTGRTRCLINGPVKELEVDGMICGCGSHVIIEEQELIKKFIPTDVLKKTIALLKEYGAGFNLEGNDASYMDPLMNAHFRDLFLRKYSDDTDKVDQLMREHQARRIEDLTKEEAARIPKLSVITTSPESLAEINSKLPEELYMIIMTQNNPPYFHGEILSKGISKASGIELVLRHFNQPAAYTIAVGDSMNDYEMIRYCGLGVSMGNGCDEIKECADYITKDITEDGIFHAFQHFNLI